MTGKRALYRRKSCTKTPCSVLCLVGIYTSDYLNISCGNLISDIELQVVASDVERAKEIIKMTEYLNESNQKEQSEFEESSQKKHITDKKVLFARFMLLFMLMVIIIYIISQVL